MNSNSGRRAMGAMDAPACTAFLLPGILMDKIEKKRRKKKKPFFQLNIEQKIYTLVYICLPFSIMQWEEQPGQIKPSFHG